MHNFIVDIRKGGDILKSYWAKSSRRSPTSSRANCETVAFKTLGLIRLSRIISNTNDESGKFQSFHVQSAWHTTHSKGLITWAGLASSADSRDQRLFKFMGTKGRVYTRKESNSHRIGLEHQFGRRDVMWKRSFTWLKPALSRHFYIEIGSNAH